MEASKSSITFKIPTRSTWSVLGLILLGVLVHFKLENWVVSEWVITPTYDPFRISVVILAVYAVTTSSICLAVNVFKPLNRWNEIGLIFGFMMTLFLGFMMGLFGSLFQGFSEGFTPGLCAGLILGLCVTLFMFEEEL